MRYRVIRMRRRALGLALLLAVALVVGSGITQRAVFTSSAGKKVPIYSVEMKEKKVALGINCAWGDEDIPQLLELLGEAGVKASFFVTGTFCKRYPDSVKAIFDAGHEVQSHSNTHVDLTKLSEEEVLEQIRKGSQNIEAITGVPATLFRPPSGAYNSRVVELIEQEGMYPIQWNCDSIDYKDPSADEMCARILKKLQPGAITLFHSGAANTPGALPGIIEAVERQGYEWVMVSELIHPRPYTVDHEGRQHPA